MVGEWLVVFGEEFRDKVSPAPTKFKVAMSNGKVILTLSWA